STKQLCLHLEAASIADALDRRRHEHESPAIRNGFDLLLQTCDERYEILSLCLLALVPIIEDDIVNSGIGKCCAVVEDGNPCNRDYLAHARRRERDLGRLIQRIDRAPKRCAIGQLHGDHGVTLVLIGDEGRWQAGYSPNSVARDSERYED